MRIRVGLRGTVYLLSLEAGSVCEPHVCICNFHREFTVQDDFFGGDLHVLNTLDVHTNKL